MNPEKMDITGIFFSGIELQRGIETINVEEYVVNEEISDNCFECTIECELSEEDSNKLNVFFQDLAVRAWKKFLAWITFCVEYFRRN